MKKKYKILLVIVTIIAILDQTSKTFVQMNMNLYESIFIIENFLDIAYIRNSGIAFGLFSEHQSVIAMIIFIILTIIALILILRIFIKLPDSSLLMQIALCSILGGAVGNLIDRVLYGEVIDFISVHWYQYYWPAFNVADSCITIGMICFGYGSIIKKGCYPIMTYTKPR